MKDGGEVVISGVWHFLIGGIAALAVVGCGKTDPKGS